MTGSLQIKNDKFYILLNTYDENGKRKQKWIATGLEVKGNKRLAEKMLREELNKQEVCEKLVKTDILFSDAVRQWLKDSAIRVDAVTLQGYEVLSNDHILPYFDALKIKLVDVDRRTLQKYIDEKYRYGRKDGKGGLSPKSIRSHKNILFQVLKDAVRNEILLSNPCEFVILPQMQRYESKFYSADQLNALLEALKNEQFYAIVKVTAVYGLRRSEVIGLKWDSVDFNANTLTIKHTVSKVTVAVEKDKTKNTSSRRSFPLLPEIKTLLLNLKQQENENRNYFGKGYVCNDYIFKWDDGRPYSPDFVSHKFSSLLKQHGFPHIRFHELRHSCASVLLSMGFSLKDVQEWLGHSDISMTGNIYGHLDVARKKSMADRLGNELSM
jgi:integrase